MIKETIAYTDYNGVQRTGVYHFNLNKAEIMKMEMGVAGGMAETLQRIIDAQDVPALMENWEKIIHASFGVKTADGSFVKRKEDLEAFMATEAYSELFMKLCTDANAASRFVNGIFPADLIEQAKAQGNIPAIDTAN